MPFCPYCGGASPDPAAACPHCGATAVTPQPGQTARLNQTMMPPNSPVPTPPAWMTTMVAKPSAMAIVGFVLSIVCVFLSSLKLFALIGLVPTILLSVLGLIKSPATRRGLAIAALVLCSVALTLALVFTARSIVRPNDFLETDPPTYSDPYGYDPFNPFGDYYGDFFDDGYYHES